MSLVAAHESEPFFRRPAPPKLALDRAILTVIGDGAARVGDVLCGLRERGHRVTISTVTEALERLVRENRLVRDWR